MHKLLIALLVVILLGGGFFIFTTYVYDEPQPDEALSDTPETSETSDTRERDVTLEYFTDESIELAFDYPGGPDGYTVEDVTQFAASEVEGAEVVKVYSLINTKEKIELETSEGGREGPPTIGVTVVRNDLNRSASMWVDAYPVLSNIELAVGNVNRDAVVAGSNAVRYTTDGLYRADNVVIAHGDYIYIFSGAYLEVDSFIYDDFQTVLDTLLFMPPAGTRANENVKIDVQVACESALTYMTFEDGAAAEVFVEDCIDGEYPEVIDRYIENLGLDGATI